MIAAQSANVSHFSPSPSPPETVIISAAMSAPSTEPAFSAASAMSTTASYASDE
ncbi:Uncharacterised protein [Mycobacterium tuberculosis]|nr:Uncharacterised protein [Mycobacterium tuberculosis]